MKRELRDKWVAALRSGTYKQTTKGVLRMRRGGYCCLGVLCEIEGVPKDKSETHMGKSVWAYDGEHFSLPSQFREDESLMIWQSALQKLNDWGTKFPKLADYIEANIPVED